jgi:hypothetical protein
MEAGFERPDCRAEYPISGGSDSVYYEWITESFRSIHPRAVAQGVIAEGEFDLDTLEQRLRAEVGAGNSCIPAPAMVGAFTRLRRDPDPAQQSTDSSTEQLPPLSRRGPGTVRRRRARR